MSKDSLLAIARDGLAEKAEITNIYDNAAFGTQGFIGGDGVVYDYPNFERTDYIPLEAGDFITYSLYEYAVTGDAPASMAIFAFYDSNKTFISAVTQIKGTNGRIAGKFDTIPANAKFVIISNKANANPYGWAHAYTFSSSKFAALKGVVNSLPPEDVQYNGRIIKAIGKDIDEWADYGWDDASVLTSNADAVNVYFERNTGRNHPSLVTRVRYYSRTGYNATLYKVVLDGTIAGTTSVMALGDGVTNGWITYDVSIPLKENEYLGINGKFVYKVAGDSFGDEKITEISSGTTGTWFTGALGLFYEGLVEDGIAERLDEFAQYSINGGDHKLLPSAIVDGATVTFDPFSIPMEAGYVKDNGSIGSVTNPNFGHIGIDVHGIKTLTMNGSGGGIESVYHAVLVFPDGQIRTFFGANVSGALTFTFKKEFVGKLYLNRFGGDTPISNGNWSIEYYPKEQMRSFDLRTLPDIIRKPFGDWSTKKVCFCGDSIVYGYTSGGTTTTYTWPYWLNDKLNFSSYANLAVGGSCYQNIDGHNWVYRQIQDARPSGYDVVFVACGINDYARGGDISDFIDAVNNILDYINTYYPNTTQFIFITPINEAGWKASNDAYRSGVSSLDDYRFAIQSCVTKKDTYHRFSVLDGKRFGFPTIECEDSAFVSAVFGDKLHPSEKGYADIYAPAVLERIV
jgi:lysophospholipase L1-like esterase